MYRSRQEKCDVLILSANLGTGHYQVSGALKASLEKERPDLSIVIYDFFDHVDPLLKHLIRFSYEQSLKHFSYGYQWFYETTRNLNPDSKLHHTIHAVGRQKLKETLELLSPRAVVCTFPYTIGVVSAIKTQTDINLPLLSVITDVAVHSQWVHPNVNAYLVASDTVAEGLTRIHVPNESIHVTGIPLREGFDRAVSSKESWQKNCLNSELPTLMIMGGGGGLLSGLENICSKLSFLSIKLQVIVLCGTNQALYSNMKKISGASKVPITPLGFVDNVAELMEISDILLTKAGGVTIFEALAKGLPMILFNPLPGHETGNVNFLLANHCAFLADSEDSVVEHIKRLVYNPSLLKEIKTNQKNISKPNASKDAASIILRHLDLNSDTTIEFRKTKSRKNTPKSKNAIIKKSRSEDSKWY